MKKLYLIIWSALISLTATAQTIGNAFYIYRNDGQFNAFLREEIDSITYSCYDLDSTYCYDDYVTQLVYTPDSIYRIPLEAIDSVGFVQPETVFQPNVMRFDDSWLSYVVSITESTITFESSIPAHLLPKVGQVVVAETMDPPFEAGFSGKVSKIETTVDGIVCSVEGVELSDIYQRLVCVGFSSSYDESDASAPRRIWGMNTEKGVRFPLPKVDLNLGPVTLSSTPNIVMKYIVCLGEHNLKNYVDLRFHQSYDSSISINASFEKSYRPEPIWLPGCINIPTSVPGLYARVQFGGFVHASGSVQISATRSFHASGVSGFVYDEGKGLSGINEWNGPQRENDDWEASINIDGSISAGLAIRLQFGICHERVASADVTAYIGPEISGHAELNGSSIVNKTLYSSIKNAEIALSVMAEVGVGYRLVGSEHKDAPVSLKLTWPINKWYIVPMFSDLSWNANNDGASGTLNGSISHNLLPKVSLGWALYDMDDNEYKKEYFPQTYRKIEDWPLNGLEKELKNLPYGSTYYAYPMVKVMGVEMRADECVQVTTGVKPPVITEFKVTKKEYKLGGFTNKGRSYDYCFNASTTVQLETDKNVADWGYVYEDPDGDPAHISLRGFGTSYTDTRYAYYRNEKKSTARLYGYVKYDGDDNYYYGESHDYDLIYEGGMCPDDNHPHAIDLGLPSGTKWACCNVGASSPESSGGYYAWGETEEKSDYRPGTYKYAQVSNSGWWDETTQHYYTLVDIGTDIAGTSYDAATANWGAPWCMPSLAQIEEFGSCSCRWILQNGVIGCLFTGPNGNCVFLPCAGYRLGEYPNFVGSDLDYWSSSLRVYDPSYSFYFSDTLLYLYDYRIRYYGLSVRPVRKN